MPDIAELRRLAADADVNFSGFLSQPRIERLAHAWLPDVNFHEDERFHSIDLAELYTVPQQVFDTMLQEEAAVHGFDQGGALRPPPKITSEGGEEAFGDGVLVALTQAEFDARAVYTHGKTLERSERLFGSETPLPQPGNPALPRHRLRARVEFRMLLETLKSDLALRGIGKDDTTLKEDLSEEPADAIWGDFDVTDMLLRRVDIEGRDIGPAERDQRRQYAKDLIADFEARDFAALEDRLGNPPFMTRVNRTVWLALSSCGLMEYNFIYAFNDFRRYGGVFTNDHEGDNEGCCLVFSREDLVDLEGGDLAVEAIAPIGLMTSAHEPDDKADERRSVDSDPAEARDGLDVFVARGSHATYLTAGTHDFFGITNILRKETGLVLAVALLSPVHTLLALAAIAIYEHFDPDPDETSDAGVTAQREVDPGSDPDTHREMALVVTPLGAMPANNIYGDAAESDAALALRAFRGKLGAHDACIDKSPRWQNKTRRYFEHLVAALESGEFRPPRRPVIIG